MTTLIVFLLVFYWVYAALVCIGMAYREGVFDDAVITITGLAILIIFGGIFLPLFKGAHLSKEMEE